MNKYVTELKLKYDPFQPGAHSKEFYGGGERRALVDQIIELSLEGNMLAAVTGPLGSGKSTMAREVRARFGADAVCLMIPATLFMNQSQFLEAIGKQLPKHKHIAVAPNVETGIARLNQYAAELDLEAQSLVLIVDDAHELSADVVEIIDSMVRRAAKSSIRIILLGDWQLIGLLQNTLSQEGQANLAHFELGSFNTEETLEYLQIKLGHAGLASALPFSGGMIGAIQNSSGGIPGAINAAAAEILLSGGGELSETLFSDVDDMPVGGEYSFDAHDHMQFDLDMPATERESDFPETDAADEFDQEHIPPRAMFIENATSYRYPIAASLLAVTLIFTFFVWNTGETPAENSFSIEVATSAAGGNVNRTQLTAPAPENVVDPVANEDIPAAAIAGTQAALEAVPVIPLPAEPAIVTTNPVASSEPVQTASASESSVPEVATPEPAAVAIPAPPVASKLSGFEQDVMKLAANSFTIQILGSHSEANVQKFIASNSLSEQHGYYATRHQNKPWFVVIVGNYRDRASASAVIDRLSPALRNMQPWIRTVGDIQRDIRQLNGL